MVCWLVLEKDEAEGLQQVEKQLKLLPTENINLLKFLWYVDCLVHCSGIYYCLWDSDFLFELQTHSQSTKMDLANLATVFGPNFIRPQVRMNNFLSIFATCSSCCDHITFYVD